MVQAFSKATLENECSYASAKLLTFSRGDRTFEGVTLESIGTQGKQVTGLLQTGDHLIKDKTARILMQ